jgi:hypothetical protein
MYVACKHNIDFGSDKERLEDDSQGLTLQVVVVV